MSLRLALAATVLAAAATGAAAAEPATGHFTITDELAPDEVAENTDIYLDGRLVAHIRLDDHTASTTVAGSAPDPAGSHAYALCGDITVRDETGRPVTHEVNATGRISDLDDRHFQALGAADFTFFYLADPTPDRVPTEPARATSGLCHPPVS